MGGVIQGSGSSSSSRSYSSSNAKDFSTEGLGVRDASLSVSYDPNLSLNGTLTYVVSTTTPLTFGGSLFAGSGATSLSTVAGNYSGSYAINPMARTNVALTLDALGNIAATTSAGCRLTGQISSLSIDNAFNLSLTTGAAPCTSTGQTY